MEPLNLYRQNAYFKKTPVFYRSFFMYDIRPDWIVLSIAMSIGFLVIKRQADRYLRTIPFYFLFALSIELMGRMIRLKWGNNVPLYNGFSIVQNVYILWCFKQILQRPYIHKLLWIIPTLCIINICFIQGFKTFHTYTYAISVLCFVACSIDYYYSIFKAAKVDNLITEPSFWFVTGVLLYNTTSLSIIGILNYISILPPEMIQLTRKMLLNVNSIFYLILTIALLCKINFRKSIPNY